MPPTVTDGVALSVRFDHDLCKSRKQIVWVVNLGGNKKPRIMGSRSPMGSGNFKGGRGGPL